MSAFFVGADHVNVILSAMHGSRYASLRMPSGKWKDPNDIDALTEIGKALLAENIKSLRARYPDDWQELVDEDVNAFTFEYDHPLSPVAVIKLCHCYAYQTCEHDEWEASWAKRFVEDVQSSMADRLPGYEAAQWHYTKPADAPKLIRLA